MSPGEMQKLYGWCGSPPPPLSGMDHSPSCFLIFMFLEINFSSIDLLRPQFPQVHPINYPLADPPGGGGGAGVFSVFQRELLVFIRTVAHHSV